MKFGDVVRFAEGLVDPRKPPYSGMVHLGPDNVAIGGARVVGKLATAGSLKLISGKYLFDSRAIVYSKIRPNLNKVCIPGIDGVCSADMYPIWADENIVDTKFLCQLMRGPAFVRGAVATSMRTGMPKINRADLENLLIDLPGKQIQRQITETLDTWDDALSTLDRLIAAKEAQTSYLRAKFVSWSRWPVCPIGDVISLNLRPEPTPKTAYKALGIRSHGKGTFQRMVERPEEVDMETVYAVGARDLILSITFAWEGAIALATPNDAGCFVSHRFPTFEVKEETINRAFLGYVVRAGKFVNALGNASPGGAGRNRVLGKREFLKIEIPLPSRVEQEQIAKVLVSADREIELLRLERAATDRQKRGLMQKLLTGRWHFREDVAPPAARVAEEAAQ
jgi:type I restriction enzyme, S subunit